MDDLYNSTTTWMDGQLRLLTSLAPSPSQAMMGDFVKLHFAEKTPQQAIILKLARIISGLRAASLLLNSGFLQEQAALCRMVNEFQDDVQFLSLAILKEPSSALLQRYLDSLFEEERSADSFRAGERVRGRALVSRKDISNFISRHGSAAGGPSQGSNAYLAVNHAFSGYVHGAAPHIMEMYDANLNNFLTEPSNNHPLKLVHEHDIWNYYYRGLLSFGYAAAAFRDDSAMKSFDAFKCHFENQSGDRLDF